MTEFLHNQHIGASILATTPMLEARDRFRDAASRNRMTLFYGEAGLGKTSSLDWLLKGQSRSWQMFVTPANRSPTAVTRMLLERLTGLPEEGRHDRLTQRLLVLLAEQQPIIAIDEAQQLTLREIETLRLLWDQTPGHFPLILIGGHNCWNTIQKHKMVLSRLRRPMEFVPLASEEVKRLMPHYHPVYASARVSLLRRIDDRFARGVLRHWNDFTATAIDVCAEYKRDTIDAEIVDRCLAMHARVPVADDTLRHAA